MNSTGYIKFRKKQKVNFILILVAQIAILVLILGLWELFTHFNVIDSFITSSPSRIIKTIGMLFADNSIWHHIAVTLNETLIGFLISVVIGVGLAVVLWLSPFVSKVLEPYLVLLNALPKIALGPLIIILTATNKAATVTMCVLICVVSTTITMLSSFLSANNNYITLLKSMGANRFQILWKFIIPNSTLSFISVLKVNIGLCWVGSIMGEYLSSSAGLGYLILYGSQVFQLDLVMTGIVIIAALASSMYLLVAMLEKFVKKR